MKLGLLLFATVAIFAALPTTSAEEAEQYAFNADVTRLMKLIINSLYSNKDIFLREIISNAADASDKIRFLALTDPKLLGEGDQAKLEIFVDADEEHNTLTIRDRGIGMTHKDLIETLGTIAKSGTQNFLEAVAKGADLNLIGQFGVGFYSSFLVADRVTVITKHNEDKQLIWESDASEHFTIREDPEGNTLGRGTKVILHLKEDEKQYLDTQKIHVRPAVPRPFAPPIRPAHSPRPFAPPIRPFVSSCRVPPLSRLLPQDLALRYSEFLDTPVFVNMKKTVKVPEEKAPEEEEKPAEEKPEEEKAPEEEEEEAETADEKPAEEEAEPKMVERTVWEYERINPNRPIWMRSPKEITDEEYTNFYKSLTKGENSEMNFRAILYTPETAPTNTLELMEKNKHIKLFVRRVLIADEFEDFLPRYLNFIRGVVDSDDMPLNVSREMLQESSLLKTIAKRLVRKILEMFSQIAKRESPEDYRKFWKNFGKNIKVGILEDQANKQRLAKLLRFESTKSAGELISLDQYVERMGKAQADIYFITGESVQLLRDSPFLDAARRKGIEVLFFTDPLDEYLSQVMGQYESHKFISVAKEGLSFGDETQAQKDHAKLLKERFEPLTAYMRRLLGDRVERVTISARLREPSEAPCVLTHTSSSFSPDDLEYAPVPESVPEPENAEVDGSQPTEIPLEAEAEPEAPKQEAEPAPSMHEDL
ncbi:putative Endoplasmin [Paratrimastix pyriformis]|uniref:Endoplasmin n=1 Tax=Paratrimastix pyriformis TaxID=342808 RepID=A0ABQ8UPP2_9EUKA|nr:putative Endoplasmin [Paratrimastix pyriformis]